MWMGSLGLILKQLIRVHLCVCPGIIVSGTMPKKPSGFTAVWKIDPPTPPSPPPPCVCPSPPQPTHSVFSHLPCGLEEYVHLEPLSSSLFLSWFHTSTAPSAKLLFTPFLIPHPPFYILLSPLCPSSAMLIRSHQITHWVSCVVLH